MKQAFVDEQTVVDDIPVSPVLSIEQNRYGSVPGLEDEELADPDELERQVFRQEFGALLQLPKQPRRSWMKPNTDEEGRPDWGAFATVDFDRHRPAMDKRLLKADQLKEQLRDTLIMLDMLRQRVPGQAYLVLRYVEQDILEMEHIVDEDVHGFVRFSLRARRLSRQIRQLREASWRKREAEAMACVGDVRSGVDGHRPSGVRYRRSRR